MKGVEMHPSSIHGRRKPGVDFDRWNKLNSRETWCIRGRSSSPGTRRSGKRGEGEEMALSRCQVERRRKKVAMPLVADISRAECPRGLPKPRCPGTTILRPMRHKEKIAMHKRRAFFLLLSDRHLCFFPFCLFGQVVVQKVHEWSMLMQIIFLRPPLSLPST